MKKLRNILIFFPLLCFSQSPLVFPTSWWIGMKNNQVQLLFKADNADFNKSTVSIKYPGIEQKQTYTFENGKYLALDIVIAPDAKPGIINIEIATPQGKKTVVKWPLNARRSGKSVDFAKGITSEDFIYLIMPDRFSNGDPKNDKIAGMRDQSLDRADVEKRHGGDIQGVINNLDYLKGLGVTAVWLTPVLENDIPKRTEHGYAFTNHYKIDPRHGGATAYKKLSDELHKRGMKLIEDAVYNHTGSQHIIFGDLPSKDWLNQWPSYQNTSYKEQALFDRYGSKKDAAIVQQGWFTGDMPDLNQRNAFVSNFLIQHALWLVEEFGVDGWRIDTYIYNDLDFMNKCNQALLDEYPKIGIFGETWVHGCTNQAYFAENNLVNMPFKSNLPGVVDFQLNLYGILPALKQNCGWMKNDMQDWVNGANALYNIASADIMYKDPMRNVLFLDNHDVNRIHSEMDENPARTKMAIQWLMTYRGIPQMYYGTEILMTGFDNVHGNLRRDFAGGWSGDAKNAFTGQGLTADEKETQEVVRKLGQFRLKSSAIKTGKMMHYLPQNKLYTYFRYDDKQTVMCVMNTAKEERELNFGFFDERTSGFTKAVNVLTGETLDMSTKVKLGGQTMLVLELQK